MPPPESAEADFDWDAVVGNMVYVWSGLTHEKFCISGGVPNDLLALGTPDDVRACCKKIIDGIARDGGYIMDAGAREAEVTELVRGQIAAGAPAADILAECNRGMVELGNRFAAGECYLPDPMFAGMMMKGVAAELAPLLEKGQAAKSRGAVVMGSVQHNVHDIGKDIVITMFHGSGFEVVNLGADVLPEKFVEAIVRHRPQVVGMSVLLTTCYKSVIATVEAIKRAGERGSVSIMVGGAAASDLLRRAPAAISTGRAPSNGLKFAGSVVGAVQMKRTEASVPTPRRRNRRLRTCLEIAMTGPFSLWERVRVRAGRQENPELSGNSCRPHPLPLSRKRERGDISRQVVSRCGFPAGETRLRRRGWMAGAIVGLALLCAAPAAGQEWTRKMFVGPTTFDFGVVARGAKVEHRFTLENTNEEDIRIESVESTCQCTMVKLTKNVLKSWEKAEIVATLDTRAEPGRKDATIEVRFAPPFSAIAQLHVHSYIRGDVVVQPGAVEFGSVNQGEGASRELKITYAGRNDWQITRVECANPYIQARAVETGRTPGTPSNIAYKLLVDLKKDAPPGYIREPLVLVTNDFDVHSARVPINIEGLVATALLVRPASLAMGVAEIGKPVTNNIVVQGRGPFRIVAIRSNDDRFSGKVPAASKTFHIVPITFVAKDPKTLPGKVSAKIRIETDLAGASPLELSAAIEIAPEK